MTDTAAIELRLIAYRKSAKDGIVVSFAIHPNDPHVSLAAADIGTRFAAALVEIGDDEKPVQPKEREHRSWQEMSPAQQAGMLCGDPKFRKFLIDINAIGEDWGSPEMYVWDQCVVSTRKDILPGTTAAGIWADLVSDYRAWCREPEVVG